MTRRIVTIRTKYHSHPVTGAGKITARCSVYGRQVTVPYPYELSGEEKHRAAAVELARRIGKSFGVEVADPLDRDYDERGRAWVFTFAIG